MTQLGYDLDTINSLCYEFACDIEPDQMKFVSADLHNLVQSAASKLPGYNYAIVHKLINQWILVREGKLNPVPRSLP